MSGLAISLVNAAPRSAAGVCAHAMEFGVVLMIGDSVPSSTRTVSIYIYDLVQALQFERAAAASGVLLVLSFALVYWVRLLEDDPRDRYDR